MQIPAQCTPVPECHVPCCDLVAPVPQPSCHDICHNSDVSFAIQHAPNETTCMFSSSCTDKSTAHLQPQQRSCHNVCHDSDASFAIQHAPNETCMFSSSCTDESTTCLQPQQPNRPPAHPQLLHRTPALCHTYELPRLHMSPCLQ